MLVKLIFLITLAVPVFFFDIKYKRIPNWLTLGSWLLYGLFTALYEKQFPFSFLIASGIALLTYLLIYFITRKQMGLGDVKLALVLGGINGVIGWYFTNLFAVLLAVTLYLFLLSQKKVNRKSRIPFGPFLCAGGITNQILLGYGIL